MCLFLLTDADGVLIAKNCCNRTEKGYEQQIKLGTYFTEDSCGTNAISLAMKTQDMIYLKGDEHYCDYFYNFECMASPIIVDDKVIGYLDISLLNKKIIKEDKMLFELLLNKLISNITMKVLFDDTEKIVLEGLTKEVLKLSANGYTIKEISKRLHVSGSSVRYHRGKISDFFKARNITHAITKAIKCKCLGLSDIR